MHVRQFCIKFAYISVKKIKQTRKPHKNNSNRMLSSSELLRVAVAHESSRKEDLSFQDQCSRHLLKMWIIIFVKVGFQFSGCLFFFFQCFCLSVMRVVISPTIVSALHGQAYGLLFCPLYLERYLAPGGGPS